MAEELTQYLTKFKIKCRHIHSHLDTLERVEILQGLKDGEFDVLIGVNLLREGLDLPEVSLVAIFDADKEGFLRSERSLTQTAGRAARNINGLVIMYADKITESMQRTIEKTNQKRKKQKSYNKKNRLKPQPIIKKKENKLNILLNPYRLIKKNQEDKFIEEGITNSNDLKKWNESVHDHSTSHSSNFTIFPQNSGSYYRLKIK